LDFPKTISERFRQQNPRLCSLGISCENPRLASNLSRNQRCAMTDTIQRIVLASRPVGEPTLDNFRSEKLPIPQPGPGQMLLRTLWLSLDPYMRGRMSDAPVRSQELDLGCGASNSCYRRIRAIAKYAKVIQFAGIKVE
jgi:hypothetical protein